MSTNQQGLILERSRGTASARLSTGFLIVCFVFGCAARGFGALAATNEMFAHFVDVGQANAILLEFRGGVILVDAGSQDDQRTQHLVQYIDRFFSVRPQLNRTISTIFTTHNHVDHTRALREVAEAFTVLNFVENGQRGGLPEAIADLNWLVANATPRHVRTLDVDEANITASGQGGFSNDRIDPISGPGTDPQISVLNADLNENPGWSKDEFENKNNHSLVIRVGFGRSSFLFTGDLEEDAIERMLAYYAGTSMLDVDVYQVGHHGSYNGTTVALLNTITPKVAVICMGPAAEHVPWSAWAYGHPRDVAVERLQRAISRTRMQKRVSVATSTRRYKTVPMRDAIYGTGWDGTVVVRATSTGQYRVTTER